MVAPGISCCCQREGAGAYGPSLGTVPVLRVVKALEDALELVVLPVVLVKDLLEGIGNAVASLFTRDGDKVRNSMRNIASVAPLLDVPRQSE